MELELKHLAPYLPYSLKVIDDAHFEPTTLFGLDKNSVFTLTNVIWTFFYKEIKPILHPLSDLTKEIEHNGEKLVPAIELAKLSVELGFYKDVSPSMGFDYSIVNKPFGKMLKISKNGQWVLIVSFNNVDRLKHSFYEKLLEWHFDVFNLIPNNLAIDINTLK